MIQRGQSLIDQISRKQMVAAGITAKTFPGFAARYFQMLRQFLSETAAVTFFDVCTDRIQTSDLLFGQFTSAKIFGEDFRIVPKLVKELASQFVNPE